MDDKTKLATVRFLAAHKRPYFATALFAMHLVSAPNAVVQDGLGGVDPFTMAVDKYGRVYMNPTLVHVRPNPPKGARSVEEAASGLLHELGDRLRKDPHRPEP